ncbi:hypothetical protein BASA81_013977 [Batrachochytrium salamandrivorans]|nr:hypothetical protein BASA81_013977 [Batrachochytrium salamandrivorans]
MPKEYIIRLLFDRSHQTICCLDLSSRELLGAISVKPFPQSHFFEIAFLAVRGTNQVKGVGSLLMNHLKEYAKQVMCTHFLTYADNFAVGYFKKQGFSQFLSLPKERWLGLIKDYDGGTLMECQVQWDVDNLQIKSMVQRMQSKYVDLVLKQRNQQSKGDLIYPGLGPNVLLTDAYCQLPGLIQAGWEKPNLESPNLSNAARVLLLTQLHGQELQQALKMLLGKIQTAHECSWPFLEPVPVDLVIDYLQIIRTPMDLGLIQHKVTLGQYLTANSMRSDLQLVIDNCMTYNHPDTNYYKAALLLQGLVDKLFGDLKFDKQPVLVDKPKIIVE